MSEGNFFLYQHSPHKPKECQMFVLKVFVRKHTKLVHILEKFCVLVPFKKVTFLHGKFARAKRPAQARFLRTKIKKFWTLQIKDQDQKITFTKWTKIVNSPDQEIKDHFRSKSLMRSKIERSLFEKITDQRRIKDQASKIKSSLSGKIKVPHSSNFFQQVTSQIDSLNKFDGLPFLEKCLQKV